MQFIFLHYNGSRIDSAALLGSKNSEILSRVRQCKLSSMRMCETCSHANKALTAQTEKHGLTCLYYIKYM